MSLTPAPDGYPIKLVRDLTAEVLNPSGQPGELWYAPMRGEQVVSWLKKKLMEEAAEYLVDPGLDELADVVAVVQALALSHDATLGDVLELCAKHERGGFMTGQMMYGRHPEFDE